MMKVDSFKGMSDLLNLNIVTKYFRKKSALTRQWSYYVKRGARMMNFSQSRIAYHQGSIKQANAVNSRHESEIVRPLSPELTEGQISIALDKDLLSLIDNITLEISRASTVSSKSNRTYSGSSDDIFEYLSSLSPIPIDHGLEVLQGVSSLNPVPRYTSVAETRTLQLTGSDSTSPRFLRSASSTSNDPLPQVLHALDGEHDDCIVVVRRITRLGFKSNRIIKSRFEQMNWEIKNVVLLPSRSRSSNGEESSVAPHARPSSMGFVVFRNSKAAADALSLGIIMIDGVEVLIKPFTRQYKPTISSSRDSS